MAINEGFRRLATDIVKSAVIDYQKAKGKLMRLEEESNKPGFKRSEAYVEEWERLNNELSKIEGFFFSKNFSILTDLDPVVLLEKLNQEG